MSPDDYQPYIPPPADLPEYVPMPKPPAAAIDPSAPPEMPAGWHWDNSSGRLKKNAP